MKCSFTCFSEVMKAPLLAHLITVSFFVQHHAAGLSILNSNETIEDSLSILSRSLNGEGLVGGNYAAILIAPYQAQLCKGYLVHCGAAIISVNWLLTAAHCLANRQIKELKVITGTQHSCGDYSSGTVHTIDRVIVHSEYDSRTLNNDICLIKLGTPMQVSQFQKPIKLAKQGPRPGAMMLISGYGSEGVNQGQAPLLKVARIPVLQPRRCKALYEKSGDKLADTAFCAGGGVETACHGDSGGPGVVGGRLAGIVSAGRDCGSPNFPTLFTRVTLFHKWIEKHTDILVQ